METRALAIALFFAIGTAVGGITGPALFGQFVHSGQTTLIATGFFIGAAAMALGGLAELAFGVRAEQQSLENIARPLTAEEAEADAQHRPLPAPAVLSDENGQRRRQRDRRVRQRTAAYWRREASGGRRFRPGLGSTFYSPGMVGNSGTTSRFRASSEESLDDEITAIGQVLDEDGAMDRKQLASRVHAGSWGPGRFRSAIRRMVGEGTIERLSRTRYGPREDV